MAFNIAVAQSGGPTCTINASLVGVVREARRQPEVHTVYGSPNGIEGFIKNRLIDLNERMPTETELDLVCRTPSTVLGSCRYKLPEYEENETVYRAVADCLTEHNIRAFFYIGGNDSMDTVMKLSRYFEQTGRDVRVIGIPKTIDNDLCCTDHTPGFGSAAKYVNTTLQEIARDSTAYSVRSVTIVEIMGRNAGWLTASTCLLHTHGETAPHLIYLPEVPFSVESFLEDVRAAQKQYRSVIVAVSEGIEIPEEAAGGSYRSGVKDIFGHRYLSGVGKRLEEIVSREIGCKVRSIELNVMQRCAAHIASKPDLEESEAIAAAGVREALAGESGKMMCFHRLSDAPYTVDFFSTAAENVANHEKKFPTEWINETKNGVLPPAIAYFRPLICGESYPVMLDGLPIHFKL